ncbi:MAG: FAD-dependent oxidoreductase [FCB group bacterium]|nr:FAD-dependent oxidoreductase [FCB group bacterium]
MAFDIKGILTPFAALNQATKPPHTIRYPKEKKETAKRYRGFHYNDLEECIGCGTCSTICQNGAIDMIHIEGHETTNGDSGLRPRVDNGRCCWCALCVDVCPTGSLNLTTDYIYVTDDPDSFLWIPGVDNAKEGNEKLSWQSAEGLPLLEYDRVPMKELEGKERIKSFAEVVLGYTEEEARKEADRCIACGICTDICPVHMHIPEYINAISRGEDEEAVRIIYDNNPLGETCGKVCTRRCETTCAISHRGEPIAIRWLKEYVTAKVENAELIREILNPEIAPPNGHSVGIIGAGPSGLTAAYYLALKGFDVTIYEAKEHAGGMIMYGIPKYRLPLDSIDKQVEYMKSIGVKIQYNTKVGTDISFNELKEKHEAIMIGIGFEIPYSIGVTGEEAEGSIQAVNFLREINSGRHVEIGDKVVVIGGGNVAIDAARVSKRLGAEVTILYRRRVKDMPADWEEIEGAEHEGVIIHPQAIPLEIISDEDGKVKAIKYANAEMIPDEKGGRPRPKIIEGDEHIIEVTSVIGAIGQEADYSFIPEDIKERIEISRGRIVVKENQSTNLPWLFACGDIANRQADAISAIADGYRAVKGIEKLLLNKEA